VTQPIITVAENSETLARLAAERFTEIATSSLRSFGRFRVALSGGSTPRRLFRLLATEPYRGAIDWSRVDVFWSDERTVPPDSPQCNFRLANDVLLGQIPIPDENIHRMRGELPDPHQAAAEYEREIRSVFGLAPGVMPRFDLILLGVGSDGHTASLFPNTDALDEHERLVVANAVPQLQTARLTLTVPVLNAAHALLLLVAGEDKSQAVYQAIEGTWNPRDTPSQLLRDAEGRVEWLLDRAAATALPQEAGRI
jgi:6-phosphogluconolactonase